MTRHLACAVALALLVLAPARPAFFPVAVWYGGGQARAPMVSPIGPGSEREWRDDLQKIKALGWRCGRTSAEAIRDSLRAMIIELDAHASSPQ